MPCGAVSRFDIALWHRKFRLTRVLVVLVCISVISGCDSNTESERPSELTEKPNADIRYRDTDRFYLSNVKQIVYRNGLPVLQITAGSVIHTRKQVGPFTINPIKEIKMKDVEIERLLPDTPEIRSGYRKSTGFHTPAAANTVTKPFTPILSDSFTETLSEQFNDSTYGFVTKISIENLILKINNPNGWIKLSANKFIVGRGHKNATFLGKVFVTTSKGESLSTEKAFWLHKKGSLYIPSKYVLRKKQRETEGINHSFKFTSSGTILISE